MQPHVVLPTQPETAEVRISDLMQWSTAECPGSIRKQQEVEVTGSLETNVSKGRIYQQANVNSSAFGIDLNPLGFIREAAARCIRLGSNQVQHTCSKPNGE
jgi:hypothetical protein